MKLVSTALTVLVLAVLVAVPAQAQATRTWVSGVGDDANPCSRTAPCKTFAGAISKTAPGGEISVLDPGSFGAVTITKSITINGDGTLAGVLVSGTNGIIISAGPTDRIILRNLSIKGLGTGINAIDFLAGGTLIVDHVNIDGFTGAGVLASLSATGSSVFVQDTNVTNCATGVRLTTSTGNVFGTLSNVRLEAVTNGLEAALGGRATISSSFVSGNSGSGILCSAANCQINAEGNQISFNGTGVNASASGAQILLSNNQIYNNTSSITISAGGLVSTSGNNRVTSGNNRVAGNAGGVAPNNGAIPVQ
ncbi:MAG: right-handed parallel beta-helix repeat-containing protein [Thermoanaerobaculia bacterium]